MSIIPDRWRQAQSENAYRAYLLRLWRSPEAGWRASLEDAHSGERSVFASLAELMAHLQQAAPDPPNTQRTADA